MSKDLQRLLELKMMERQLKEERIELETQIVERFKNVLLKNSNTIREGDYKITIKLNNKLKIVGVVPEGVDIYTPKVDDKKLKMYAGMDWVEETQNKPTIDVVKEI